MCDSHNQLIHQSSIYGQGWEECFGISEYRKQGCLEEKSDQVDAVRELEYAPRVATDLTTTRSLLLVPDETDYRLTSAMPAWYVTSCWQGGVYGLSSSRSCQ